MDDSDRFAQALAHLRRVIADKAELRERNRQIPWHEKAAMIERVRAVSRIAKRSMDAHLAKLVAAKAEGNH